MLDFRGNWTLVSLTFVRDDLPNNKNGQGDGPVVSLQAFL